MVIISYPLKLSIIRKDYFQLKKIKTIERLWNLFQANMFILRLFSHYIYTYFLKYIPKKYYLIAIIHY